MSDNVDTGTVNALSVEAVNVDTGTVNALSVGTGVVSVGTGIVNALSVEAVNVGTGIVNASSVGTGVVSVGTGVVSVGTGVVSVGAGVVNVGTGVVNVGTGVVSVGAGEIDINKIISFLKNFNYVNDVITTKLCITITEEQNTKLTNILEYLCTDIQSKLPLKNMIQQIKVIFDDNKIDIYDIPTIIEIITNFFNTNMSSVNIQNITVDDIALCIKVLLIIFIETNVVGNNMNIELPVILKLFDSSLKLLKLHINVKNKLCINFFNCCKK
jgi:hypothetical protein